MNIVGLDIGGTKIEGVFWRSARVLNAAKIKTPKNRREFLAAVFQLIKEVSGEQKYSRIGIACAGAMDHKHGIILNSPNLKFLSGLKLGLLVSKKFGKPVAVDNDTNCFLLGEAKFGAARGKKNVVALTLGTGVGGAVTIDGKLLRGFHGAAGELGHIMVSGDIQKALTLEDLCSSHFFERKGLGRALSVQLKAEAGSKTAIKAYQEFGRNLGRTLASLTNIFDPELIILGGGISRGSHLFLRQALAEVRKYSMLPSRFLPPIKISRLEHAGALGAISVFLEK